MKYEDIDLEEAYSIIWVFNNTDSKYWSINSLSPEADANGAKFRIEFIHSVNEEGIMKFDYKFFGRNNSMETYCYTWVFKDLPMHYLRDCADRDITMSVDWSKENLDV